MTHPAVVRAQGRWPFILTALDILNAKALAGQQVPCPLCGGEDRFNFTDEAGTGRWFCRACNARGADGFDLVGRVHRVERFSDKVAIVDGVLGSSLEGDEWLRGRQSVPTKAKAKGCLGLSPLWPKAERIAGNSPVVVYLANRGIEFPDGKYPEALRAVPRARACRQLG